MNNIFDGFAKLSDDEIKAQIAILKCITFSNTLKEQGQKAMKFLVDAAGGFFGRSQDTGTSEEMVRLINVKRLIDETYNELSKFDRDKLDAMLKEELINKCKQLNSYDLTVDSSEGAVHVAVIREAAKVYSIEQYMSPGQQADEIREKYYEHYLKVLRKSIDRIGAEEKAALENNLQRRITKTDINQMRQLATELMLREFNGKTILTKIMVTPGINILKKVIDYMGLGVFDAIGGVINTAYDSMLTFCRLERAILAQVVWTAVNGYGKKMVLNADLMPSYNQCLSGESEEKERKLLTFIAREKQLNEVIRELLREIDKSNRMLESKEKVQELDRQRLMNVQGEYRDSLVARERMAEDGEKAKKVYDEYLKINPSPTSSDAEYRSIKVEYENAARVIRSQDYKIVTHEKNIMKLSESLEKQRIQIEEINRMLKEYRDTLVENVNEFNQVIVELENEAGYYAQVLSRKWTHFYVDWNFGQKVFESVVKQFTTREWVEIERMLTEMEQSGARESFAFKTTQTQGAQQQTTQPNSSYEQIEDMAKQQTATKTFVTYCLVSAGKYARITYQDNLIMDIGVKDRR